MTYRDAYEGAGYSFGSNYLDLMQRPLIRAALYQKVKEHEVQGDISTGQWLRELSTIGFMPSDQMAGPPTWRDKLKALELLGRYQKWLTDNKHVSIDIGISRLFGIATVAVTSETAKATTLLPAPSDNAMVEQFAGAVLEHVPPQGKS